MKPKVLYSRAIRTASAADATNIARIHCQSHLETYRPIFGADYTGPSEAQRTAHWRERLESGDILYVARIDNEIVGFTHAIEEPDGHATLTTLYLLRAHHRRGIGRDLLQMLLNHLHGRGHAEAQIDCLLANAGAIAFYKSQGAREIGRHGDESREEVRFTIATRALAL